MDKSWYTSKLFWLGVINFMIGSLALVGEFLSKSDFSPLAVTTLATGVLVVVLRVWFTDTKIS
jgi:hypothetical protein